MDQNQTLALLYGIDKLQCGLRSNGKVIEKYWHLSIHVPAGQTGMIGIVSYQDGYAGIFTSDFTYIMYMLKNNIDTEKYSGVATKLDNDPIMPLFDELRLSGVSGGIGYDVPIYILSIVIPGCETKISCYYPPNINLTPVIAECQLLSKKISIQATSEHDNFFHNLWY